MAGWRVWGDVSPGEHQMLMQTRPILRLILVPVGLLALDL